MTVGNRLSEERRRLNLSQERLAIAMKIGRSAVAMIETDRTGLAAEHFSALEGLGIDVTYVQSGTKKADAIAEDINWQLIEGILDALQKWSTVNKVKLTPKKTTQALKILYADFAAKERFDSKRVDDLMAFAA